MNNTSICYSVARVMCYNGISLEDIVEALKKIPPEEKFDLAVRVKDKVCRLPVNDANTKLDVVGVFPFKDDERYLELGETDEVTMKDKLQNEVPTMEDFAKLSSIRKPLNELLEHIGGLPLSGRYHTVQIFGDVRRCYPFYVFDVDTKRFDASFEHGELKAKLRRFTKP